ncbi:MAG: hypothetical protein AB2693_32840, partial [Candidatus Thiodiazotropha sp.]
MSPVSKDRKDADKKFIVEGAEKRQEQKKVTENLNVPPASLAAVSSSVTKTEGITTASTAPPTSITSSGLPKHTNAVVQETSEKNPMPNMDNLGKKLTADSRYKNSPQQSDNMDWETTFEDKTEIKTSVKDIPPPMEEGPVLDQPEVPNFSGPKTSTPYNPMANKQDPFEGPPGIRGPPFGDMRPRFLIARNDGGPSALRPPFNVPDINQPPPRFRAPHGEGGPRFQGPPLDGQPDFDGNLMKNREMGHHDFSGRQADKTDRGNEYPGRFDDSMQRGQPDFRGPPMGHRGSSELRPLMDNTEQFNQRGRPLDDRNMGPSGFQGRLDEGMGVDGPPQFDGRSSGDREMGPDFQRRPLIERERYPSDFRGPQRDRPPNLPYGLEDGRNRPDFRGPQEGPSDYTEVPENDRDTGPFPRRDRSDRGPIFRAPQGDDLHHNFQGPPRDNFDMEITSGNEKRRFDDRGPPRDDMRPPEFYGPDFHGQPYFHGPPEDQDDSDRFGDGIQDMGEMRRFDGPPGGDGRHRDRFDRPGPVLDDFRGPRRDEKDPVFHGLPQGRRDAPPFMGRDNIRQDREQRNIRGPPRDNRFNEPFDNERQHLEGPQRRPDFRGPPMAERGRPDVRGQPINERRQGRYEGPRDTRFPANIRHEDRPSIYKDGPGLLGYHPDDPNNPNRQAAALPPPLMETHVSPSAGLLRGGGLKDKQNLASEINDKREKNNERDKPENISKTSMESKQVSAQSSVRDKRKTDEPKANEKEKEKSKKDENVKSDTDCTVMLTGMPLTSNYRDARQFLSGCDIPRDGLKLINDAKGQRIGVAYVRFNNKRSYESALQKHSNKMGNKPVSVLSVTLQEFDKAIDSYFPEQEAEIQVHKDVVFDSAKKYYIVRVEGLPETVSHNDLRQFFLGCTIARNSDAVFLEYKKDGKCTGTAFVEFTDEASFNISLKLNKKMGKNNITIKKSSPKDVEDLINRMSKMIESKNRESEKEKISKSEKSENKKNDKTTTKTETKDEKNSKDEKAKLKREELKKLNPFNTPFVHVKNLPEIFTPRDLRLVFDGLEVAPRGIQLSHDAIGRPHGDGYVEFISPEVAVDALGRHNITVGRNKLEVKLVTKSQMVETMRLQRQSLVTEKPSKEAVYFFVKASNLPVGVRIGEIMNFFQGFHPLPESVRLNVQNDSAETMSTALVGFKDKDNAE